MHCPKCGRRTPSGSRTCIHCTTLIGDHGDAAVAVAVEAGEEDQERELEQVRERLAAELAGVYELEAVLGSGGMAHVFRATDVELRRPVALKVLRPHLLATASAADRFRQEARIAAGLEHPNIIPIHRVGYTGGVYYIAMKFIEGRSLYSIVESQGALPLPIVLNILRASLSALAHAHEHGIVHRDIKGGNILVDTEGRVTVADFGIARPLEDTGFTATGILVGTPAFMSPEQWAGDRVTAQSDQYAVGILAFQLLTGSEPFEGDSLPVIMQHHLFTPAPDVRAARVDVPDALVAIVNRALAKDPAARYPTTRDMLTAVEAIPFSDADSRKSTDSLRQLARGAGIEKVRTRSLPPLPDIRAQFIRMGRGVRVVSTLLRRWPVLTAGLVGVAALGGVLFVSPGAPKQARQADSAVAATDSPTAGRPAAPAGPAAEVRRDSVPPVSRSDASPRTPPARPPSTAPATPVGEGMLRVSTRPPTAEIRLDGKPIGVGGVFDRPVPAGRRRLTIQAPGYQTFDTVLTIRVEVTSTLSAITLKPRDGVP